MPVRKMLERILMYRKTVIIAAVLSFLFMGGLVGCGGKQVRNLASDASLVTPGTTKQEVINYLGQPDAQYETPGGNTLWIYYEARQDLLRKAPYIGERFGEETYEIVRVTFNGDNVENIGYRTMKEDEFKESGIAE